MKTTDKHYNYFKSRCQYYQKEFGLMGWDVEILHEDIDAYASCLCDNDERWCVIKLSTRWDEHKPVTLLELDISAYHEIIHLRLASLRWLAKTRFTSMDEINRADEEAVTAFENYYRGHYVKDGT